MMALPKLDVAQRRFAVYVSISALIAFIIVGVLVETVGKRFHLAMDATTLTCLPWRMFVLDTHQVPLESIRRGDLLQFVARNAAPLPNGFKVTKFVAGLPGDKVVIRQDQFYINGQHFGRLPHLRMLKKKSGTYDREFIVQAGQYVMIGTELESFDSRYWGPIHADQILGRVYIIG